MSNREWVLAVQRSSTGVQDGQNRFHPDIVLLADADSRYVLGCELVAPDEVAEAAVVLVRGALAAPRLGAPSRVRIASPELGEAVRGAVDVEVVIAKTPEASAIIAELDAHLTRAAPAAKDSYFDGGATADELAAFFVAAARLYRASPWAAIPSDECLAVDCAELGLRDGRLAVVGHMGQSFGFALYPDRAAFELASSIGELTPDVELPRMIMLDYAPRQDASKDEVAEIRRHRWAIAGPRAYPKTMFVERRDLARPLDARELAGMTAVIEALAELVEHTPDLARRWHDLPPARATSRGASVVAPAPPRHAIAHAPQEHALAARLRASVITARGDLDDARVDDYLAAIEEGLSRVADVEMDWGLMFAEAAATQLGKTLGELSPHDAREILFGFFPRKVSVAAAEAPAIVASVRAVLGFAARELGGYGPNRCLDGLRGDAVDVLASELADPANFGPAKQMMMEGIARGYDLSTEAGMAEWVAEVNRGVPQRTPSKATKPRKPTKPTKPTKKRKKR